MMKHLEGAPTTTVGSNSSDFTFSMADAFQMFAGGSTRDPPASQPSQDNITSNNNNNVKQAILRSIEGSGDPASVNKYMAQQPTTTGTTKSALRKRGAQISPDEYALLNEYRQRVLAAHINTVKSSRSASGGGSGPTTTGSPATKSKEYLEESNNRQENSQIMAVNEHFPATRLMSMCSCSVGEEQLQNQQHFDGTIPEEVMMDVDSGSPEKSPLSPRSFLSMPEVPLLSSVQTEGMMVPPQSGAPLLKYSAIFSSDASDYSNSISRNKRNSCVGANSFGGQSNNVNLRTLENKKKEKVRIHIVDEEIDVQWQKNSLGGSSHASSISSVERGVDEEGGRISSGDDPLEGWSTGSDSEVTPADEGYSSQRTNVSQALDLSGAQTSSNALDLSGATTLAEEIQTTGYAKAIAGGGHAAGYLPFFATPLLFVPSVTDSEDEPESGNSSLTSSSSMSSFSLRESANTETTMTPKRNKTSFFNMWSPVSGSPLTSQHERRNVSAPNSLLFPVRDDSLQNSGDKEPQLLLSKRPEPQHQMAVEVQLQRELQRKSFLQPEGVVSGVREPEGDRVTSDAADLVLLEPEGDLRNFGSFHYKERTAANGSSTSRTRSKEASAVLSTPSGKQSSPKVSMCLDTSNSFAPDHNPAIRSPIDSRNASPRANHNILESESGDATPFATNDFQGYISITDDGYDQYDDSFDSASQLLQSILTDSSFDRSSFFQPNASMGMGTLRLDFRHKLDSSMNESAHAADRAEGRSTGRQDLIFCNDSSESLKLLRSKDDEEQIARSKQQFLFGEGTSFTFSTEKMTDGGDETSDGTSLAGTTTTEGGQTWQMAQSADIVNQEGTNMEEVKVSTGPDTMITTDARGTKQDQVELLIVNDRILVNDSPESRESIRPQPTVKEATEFIPRRYSSEEEWADSDTSDSNILLEDSDSFSSSVESKLSINNAEQSALAPTISTKLASISDNSLPRALTEPHHDAIASLKAEVRDTVEQDALVPTLQVEATDNVEQVPLVPALPSKSEHPHDNSSSKALNEPYDITSDVALEVAAKTAQDSPKGHAFVTALIRKVGSYDAQTIADKTRRQLMRTAFSPEKLASIRRNRPTLSNAKSQPNSREGPSMVEKSLLTMFSSSSSSSSSQGSSSYVPPNKRSHPTSTSWSKDSSMSSSVFSEIEDESFEKGTSQGKTGSAPSQATGQGKPAAAPAPTLKNELTFPLQSSEDRPRDHQTETATAEVESNLTQSYSASREQTGPVLQEQESIPLQLVTTVQLSHQMSGTETSVGPTEGYSSSSREQTGPVLQEQESIPLQLVTTVQLSHQTSRTETSVGPNEGYSSSSREQTGPVLQEQESIPLQLVTTVQLSDQTSRTETSVGPAEHNQGQNTKQECAAVEFIGHSNDSGQDLKTVDASARDTNIIPTDLNQLGGASENADSCPQQVEIRIYMNEIDLELAMPLASQQHQCTDQISDLDTSTNQDSLDINEEDEEIDYDGQGHAAQSPGLTLSSASDESSVQSRGDEWASLLATSPEQSHDQSQELAGSGDVAGNGISLFERLTMNLPKFSWHQQPTPLLEPLLPVSDSFLENPLWLSHGPYAPPEDNSEPPSQVRLGIVFSNASFEDDLDLEEGQNNANTSRATQRAPEAVWRLPSGSRDSRRPLHDGALTEGRSKTLCVQLFDKCCKLRLIWSLLASMFFVSMLSTIVVGI